MATVATLPALLDSLTKSLSSALEAAPKLATISPPKDGISLLDVKNELLLSYLQNLVFLILLKLRQTKNGAAADQELDELVVKKLVELRLYLEKGARPLEDKLRYQIDKMLRAADDAERSAKAAEEAAKAAESESEFEADGEEGSGDEDGGHGGKLDAQKTPGAQLFGPNVANFAQPEKVTGVGKSSDGSGVYKPPRIAPTVMPTTERREKKEGKKMKSAVMDEFVADELSAVPMAQPSIGTTIAQGGRKIKTERERRAEEERRNYEETNFVRLPAESKKDRAKRAKAEGGSKRMDFGGEEWRDLGAGLDRIHRLTQGKSSGKGTKALLEKSRKRGLETTDGPKGDGSNMGERYQKRLKVLEGGRGTRGKGR
ncbi:Sas10/Utp3/C1D family-domain-containing protein [Podospora aff. communis PSN243]|uniref:Sas10/Utp3/C1D family-domain-containing protein n=1 Tax=Podospora aff. communis PSN243 TaxID=3040156 RepID=A0AAV9GNU8_9PEZI|nr:Sas10/Utp3/C1D family-domain-containing protein [Podospora aff. communis PSN243]